MYSRLDPIFKTQFRHTETLDTRQGIYRHDEPDDRSKQQDFEENTDDQDLWVDKTSVSVRSLKVFLEQLTKQAQPGTDNGKETIALSPAARTSSGQDGADHHSAGARKAAHAAQAYQRTYRATHNDDELAPPPNAFPDIDLTPEEMRVIHRLIDDLGKLEQQNVKQLNIRKSDSFLQSLVDAVAEAKR